MEPDSRTCSSRDILSNPVGSLLVFCLPPAAMVVVAARAASVAWRTGVWTVALVIMGVGCAVNAIRCGRIHCYITAPFFFLMALVTLLYGLGILSIRGSAWNLIGLTVLVGAIVLSCLPEMLFGKYRLPRA